MNALKIFLAAVITMAGALSALPAAAHGYPHGYYGRPYGYWRGPGVGIYYGGPYGWGPGYYGYYGYYGPTYVYPPTVYGPVVVPTPSPPVYIERDPEPAAPAQPAPSAAPAAPSAPGTQWWYLCASPRGAYPYVRECPGGWERVPALPPGQVR